jgi:cytoskeletal protein RodZ
MNEEARRVGAILKVKRKELHLSLKEVENATSIRSNYLESIEEGNIHAVIAAVYALGFVKQYALFLGFDLEKLIHEYPQAFRSAGEKHEFAYGIGTLEKRGSMGGGVKWLPNFLWATLSVFLLFCAWFFAKFLGVL